MAYSTDFSRSALGELESLRKFDQQRVADAIERNLVDQPFVETRNKKNLGDQVTADFEYIPPLWELRIGEFRAFYTGDEDRSVVTIHAIRRKPPQKTTAEVLQ